MANSPRLGYTYLEASQSQKHVTVNDALRDLDCFGPGLQVEDRDATAPPGSPADGSIYIPAATATGAWAGQEGKVAFYTDSAWYFFTPAEGWLAYVKDEDLVIKYDGSAWVRLQQKAAGFKAEKTTNTTLTGTYGTIDSFDATAYIDSATFSFNMSTGVLTVADPGRYLVGCSALITTDGAGTSSFQANLRLMRSTDGGGSFTAVLGFRNGVHCIGGDEDDIAIMTVLPVDTTVDDELLVMQQRAFGSLTDVPEYDNVIFWAERIG